MVSILHLSGRELHVSSDVLEQLREKTYGNSVRALKWHLQAEFGVSIYRLKLISDDALLADSCPLPDLKASLSLAIVDYHTPTDDEAENFLWAAQEGQLAHLETLLQLPIDPNGVFVPEEGDNQTQVGMCALELAACEGHAQAVELLLDACANIDHVNSFEETAIWQAASEGHEQVVELLVQRRACLNQRSTRLSQSPLQIAIGYAHFPVARLLIEARADLPDPPLSLHDACACGHFGTCESLIQARGTVDALDSLRQSALHIACEHKHVEIVKLLVDSKANVNLQDGRGRTPLSIIRTRGTEDRVAAATIAYRLQEAGGR